MNRSKYHPVRNTVRFLLMTALVIALTLGTGQKALAFGSPAPVDLGCAASFVILTKTGVTNVPPSAITGDIGVSPIAATGITGFSLIADSTNTFSKSSQVTGKIYAADYASPTPANMTTAVSNMETAYTDAAGRAPDATELYAGNLSGRTLAPGVYKWTTGVLITTNVTFAGTANDIWILQISGDLKLNPSAIVKLSGGAQAKNIFWQVGGGAGATLGTSSHMEGTILAAKGINLRTGASLKGRALAQTAVTLQKNSVEIPGFSKSATFKSSSSQDGWVLESSQSSNIGGSVNTGSTTFNLGDDPANRQYRTILHFNTSALPNTAVVTSVVLVINSNGPAVGTNPFTALGSLLVDIRKPYFGTTAGLSKLDFQAIASSPDFSAFDVTPIGNLYYATLNSSAFPYINLTGTTQFRLRFATNNNNNNIADYMSFYSGNALAETRPQLVINFYIP